MTLILSILSIILSLFALYTARYALDLQLKERRMFKVLTSSAYGKFAADTNIYRSGTRTDRRV